MKCRARNNSSSFFEVTNTQENTTLAHKRERQTPQCKLSPIRHLAELCNERYMTPTIACVFIGKTCQLDSDRRFVHVLVVPEESRFRSPMSKELFEIIA